MDSPWYRNMFSVQDVAIAAAHCYLRRCGLRHTIAPITTGSISSPMGAGSDSLPVEITLNEKRVYLADSMQFALEYGCRFVPEGTYYIMQSFRGESADSTHLNQFCHIEFEIPGPLETTMSLAWGLLREMCIALLEETPREIAEAAGSTKHLEHIVLMEQAPVIDFEEAISSLSLDEGDFMSLPGGARAITKSGEKKVCSQFGDGEVVWISGMDKLSVPFYQADSVDGVHSLAADLLLGGRETIGSGQRHTTAAEVLKGLRDRDVSPDEYKWYVEMKESHPIQTSGMGLGYERFLLWALRGDDIRDIPLLSRLGLEGNTP